jgi:hypothetical protein
MRALEFLKEYADPKQAKQEILSRVNAMDPNDEDTQKLLDRVYSIVNATGVVDRFKPIVDAKLDAEYNENALKDISEKIVASTRLNLAQKNKFISNLEQNKCIKSDLFLKSGHYSLNDLFYGSTENFQMFMEFLDYGAGKSRAGKGEHALAILSQNITQKGKGDIDVDGNPVELKVASTKGSGRLGEGGVSPEKAKTIIGNFEELTDALNNYSLGGHDTGDEFIKSRGKPDKPQKSVNLVDFVRIVNSLRLGTDRRQQIGNAVFNNVFGETIGSQVTAVFQNAGASPKAVLDAYISANFDWYKANPDMGGSWQYLTSLSIGTNAMVTATSGNDLAKLNAAGALSSSIPAIIPTQDPEVFFQVNPTSK